MNFVRPEAQKVVRQWREVLIGAAVLTLGLYWASGFGLLKWIGAVVAIAGGAMIVAGIQRARFRGKLGGPGLVQVDEREITYYGPLDGGAVAIDEMTGLSLDARSDPPVWVLRQPSVPPLHIPVNAEGTDALFDAFAALPGIRTEHMLAQLKAKPDHPVVIWSKQAARLH